MFDEDDWLLLSGAFVVGRVMRDPASPQGGPLLLVTYGAARRANWQSRHDGHARRVTSRADGRMATRANVGRVRDVSGSRIRGRREAGRLVGSILGWIFLVQGALSRGCCVDRAPAYDWSSAWPNPADCASPAVNIPGLWLSASGPRVGGAAGEFATDCGLTSSIRSLRYSTRPT